MLNIRKLKLAIATGNETEEIKSLNIFFDDLFSDMVIYCKNTYIFFIKNKKLIMVYHTYDNYLNIDSDTFWSSLNMSYDIYQPYNDISSFINICDIFRYKFIEKYDDTIAILKPLNISILTINDIRDVIKLINDDNIITYQW